MINAICHASRPPIPAAVQSSHQSKNLHVKVTHQMERSFRWNHSGAGFRTGIIAASAGDRLHHEQPPGHHSLTISASAVALHRTRLHSTANIALTDFRTQHIQYITRYRLQAISVAGRSRIRCDEDRNTAG